MKPRDVLDLLLLAAVWGASFLFIRYAAPTLGALPLIWLRTSVATLCLLPLLAWHGQAGALRQNARPLALMSVFNTALPFALIAWAMLSLSAGLGSILNAFTPIATALIAAAWLGERLGPLRWAGLALGVAGVMLLAADRATLPGEQGRWAVLALLAGTACYGFAANYARQRLQGVSPLVNATGSQLVSAVLLLPPALAHWPAQAIAPRVWLAAAALGVVCTALAYLMYFRLLARIGPARTVTVTFLIPLFGMLWGALLLDERPTPSMLLATGVILAGTALGSGLHERTRPARP